MELGSKYINAVAADLIGQYNWSLVQADGECSSVVLAKKEEEILKLIFLGLGENNAICLEGFFPAVRVYMKKVYCTCARVLSVMVSGRDAPGCLTVRPADMEDIEVLEVQVNLSEGTINGEGLEQHLLDVLNKYLDLDLLEHRPGIDLQSICVERTTLYPVITYAILLVNFILWGLMMLAGGSTDTDVLIRFGAMYGPLIVKGEYWRLVTPLFLHVGIMHLAFNSYALYRLGSLTETVYGRRGYLFIYFAAGVTGSLFSFLFTRTVSAGASGAIFGLLGALLYFGRKKPWVFSKGFTGNLITIIIINLFIGFTYPGIDNFAHIGGLLGGYVSGYFVGIDKNSSFTFRQYAYIAVFGIFILFMVFAGTWIYREDSEAMYYRARQYVEKGHFSQAEEILEDMIRKLPEDDILGIEARYLYAYSRARQGDFKTAIRYAKMVVKRHPDSHNAHLLLGALYLNVGEREKAVWHLREVLRLDPSNKEAKELLEKL